MESLSDGVFAFALTLLVLDLALHPPGTPLQQLLRAWPDFLAYLVSFVTIGAAWLAHTSMTDRLARTDPIFLRLNLFGLLVVALLPFPTILVAQAVRGKSGEQVFVTLYGLTLLAIRLLGYSLDAYARRRHLYAPQWDKVGSAEGRRTLLPVLIGYPIAVLLGIAAPAVAVALYFAFAIYLMLPLRPGSGSSRRHS
jgi:uncharacterized membrane protein